MTCTVMSMSGSRTGLIEIIILKALRSRPKALRPGWPRRYGGVTGAAKTGIAGAHPAASAHRTVAATAWVFV